ncbi:MAG: PhoX family phosphatase [Synoicihabitans sp.]
MRSATTCSAAFLGLRTLVNNPLAAAMADAPSGVGFGPIQSAGGATVQLPAGFSFTTFSHAGEEMDDGLLVPGMHDGMAAFAGPDGKTLLVRNHENESAWMHHSPFGPGNERLGRVDATKIYDRGGMTHPGIGGTSTLVFDTRTQKLEKHFLSLLGTQRNCAGGPTPWGTWITCEEVNAVRESTEEQWHGYNFEVMPSTEPGLVEPIPLRDMGRFRHEAVAVDPNSGAVYETEDLGDGLFYRFLPHEPGKLAKGGRLQALAIKGQLQADTRNWPTLPKFPIGEPVEVEWIDLENPDSPTLDLRYRGRAKGAAVFARGEGAWWGEGEGYFAMTNGGANTFGQIFRYVPSPYEGTARESEQPGTLELFVEPNDTELIRNCDNLTIAPWGDLVVCEDTKGVNRMMGITPAGEFYPIAVVGGDSQSEWAGACFSPDGTTLFANIQKLGMTVAITGPWPTT